MNKPTREECADMFERMKRANYLHHVCERDWLLPAAAYLRDDAARVAELEAQAAGLRKALEWLWGEGVVVFEAMTDDNGSSLWAADLEPFGGDDTDHFYRSLAAATKVPVKHLWPEVEESDGQ